MEHPTNDNMACDSPLRYWRWKRRLTVATLSETTGISIALITEIETGHAKGDWQTLTKLARALDAGIEDIS